MLLIYIHIYILLNMIEVSVKKTAVAPKTAAHLVLTSELGIFFARSLGRLGRNVGINGIIYVQLRISHFLQGI